MALGWALVYLGLPVLLVGTLVDGLAAMMLITVCIISLLVHIYSTEYLHGDVRFTHYYAFLSLFTASMLFYVLSSNTLQMLVGWELVGVCSFGLIGHWWEEKKNTDAALKAFLTNRVGDIGLILGVIITFFAAGGTSFNVLHINEYALSQGANTTLLLVGALCLFGGVTSKSGQFPLHTWLPDAMAGPTPVSALIHAATMVVAGVYLIARLYAVFFSGLAIGSSTFHYVAFIGGFTTIIGGLLAFVQTDLKKVLAYSTISQLGYMVMALGVGAWTAGVFHLFTHAFFKALLFLGSGSVIHGMHHEQDMRRMGALRKLMPVTAVTFIIGWLAIAGVPPFAGFWSKDEILLYVYANNRGLYVVGLVTALLTAYYMTRQVIMVFYGEAKWKNNAQDHGAHGDFEPHESPKIMLFPLVVLAGLSVVGGAMQLPFSKKLHFLEHWLAPVVEESEADIHKTWAYENKYVLLMVAVLIAATGIAAAFAVYAKKKAKAIEPRVLEQAWFYDAGAAKLIGGPGRAAFNAVAWADTHIVDGAVNGTATLVRNVAGQVRKSQSGFTRLYAALMAVGAVALLAWFLYRGVA